MTSMKDFFGSLFGKRETQRNNEAPARAERRNEPRRREGELYKKGDVIGGNYEVHGTLGILAVGLVAIHPESDARCTRSRFTRSTETCCPKLNAAVCGLDTKPEGCPQNGFNKWHSKTGLLSKLRIIYR